jgi:hypothetical protein
LKRGKFSWNNPPICSSATHIHYQPLLGHIIGSGFNVHATQTASNLHTRGMLFNENETPPNCDKAIHGLNKKRRLSYHNLKRIMHEIRPSCDEAIQGLNKKHRLSYHNLKKIMHEIRPVVMRPYRA